MPLPPSAPPSEPITLPSHMVHGSFTAYKQAKCRCAQCREANKLHRGVFNVSDGYLLVNCWCESTSVLVPSDELWNGQTHACHRPICHP